MKFFPLLLFVPGFYFPNVCSRSLFFMSRVLNTYTFHICYFVPFFSIIIYPFKSVIYIVHSVFFDCSLNCENGVGVEVGTRLACKLKASMLLTFKTFIFIGTYFFSYLKQIFVPSVFNGFYKLEYFNIDEGNFYYNLLGSFHYEK